MKKVGPYVVKHNGRHATFDHAKMRKMTIDGASAEEIAREVGCSKKYVFNWRYKSRMTNKYDWRGKA